MSGAARIGVIGCGGMAKRHISQLLAKDDCQIVALCDVNAAAVEDRRGLVREMRPGADPFGTMDWKEALKRDDVDGVVIILPHSLHYPVAKAALEAGKHVLCEKPLTTSIAEAKELVEIADRKGRKLAVAYQRSYMPEYLYVKQAVAGGELGKIRLITAHVEQAWFANVTKTTGAKTWKSDPKMAGGGQLVDTGSHTIAAMLYMAGLEPKEVFAFVDFCGLDVDVNSSLVVRFAGGAQASITVGGFGHSVTESVRIVGEKASAHIFFRTQSFQSLEVNGEAVDAKARIAGSNPDTNFVDALQGRAQIGADGRLGLKVAQLSEAAYVSARERRPVAV